MRSPVAGIGYEASDGGGQVRLLECADRLIATGATPILQKGP